MSEAHADDGAPASPPAWPGVIPAKGFAMGLADSVPGISGGTVALILGIYPRLVKAIAGLGANAAHHVRAKQWKAAWRDIDGTFLFMLALGIGTGLILGARAVGWAIERYPVPLMAFLLGLMAASARMPARVPQWRPTDWAAACAAALVAFLLAVVPQLAAPSAYWFLPVAGAIAACAMILPGISGSALLVLMGLYQTVILAVGELDLLVIALVGLGAAIGLLTFSKVLRRLLVRHEGATHAAMVGLLLGSLALLWPWRTAAGFAEGLPAAPDHLMPIAWIALGVVVIVSLERISHRQGPSQKA